MRDYSSKHRGIEVNKNVLIVSHVLLYTCVEEIFNIAVSNTNCYNMKTKILLCALALATVCSVQAQEKYNNIHVGLEASNYGFGVMGSANFNVVDNVAVGPIVMLKFNGNAIGYYRWFNTFIGLGVKGDYYFDELLPIPKEFDVYAGGHAGWYIVRSTSSYNGPAAIYYDTPKSKYGNGRPFVQVEVGGRWHFKPKMSLFAEVYSGYPASGARGGLAFGF